MSKGFVLAALLAGLGAVGCTSTTPGGRQWAADPDKPPPVATNTRSGATELEMVKLPAAKTSVSADDIDETNLADAARRLESEMKVEKRAVTQVGK